MDGMLHLTDRALWGADLARAGADAIDDVLHRLQIEADAEVKWHNANGGRRRHLFRLGGLATDSWQSRNDAAWRWASLALPEGHRLRLVAVLRRLESAKPSARIDILRQACADTGGWWRDNPRSVTLPATEIDCCGLIALGGSAQDAAYAWLRQARALPAEVAG